MPQDQKHVNVLKGQNRKKREEIATLLIALSLSVNFPPKNILFMYFFKFHSDVSVSEE